MKKILPLFLLIASFSISQNIVNKNGFSILPEKGDWSIGTDASTFINFFGNIFSGNNESIDINFHNGTFLYAKKMVENNYANRYKIGAFFNS